VWRLRLAVNCLYVVRLTLTSVCLCVAANITATYINLLGYEAPDKWEPSLLAIK
jgi:hypothetical protein